MLMKGFFTNVKHDSRQWGRWIDNLQAVCSSRQWIRSSVGFRYHLKLLLTRFSRDFFFGVSVLSPFPVLCDWKHKIFALFLKQIWFYGCGRFFGVAWHGTGTFLVKSCDKDKWNSKTEPLISWRLAECQNKSFMHLQWPLNRSLYVWNFYRSVTCDRESDGNFEQGKNGKIWFMAWWRIFMDFDVPLRDGRVQRE